MSYPHGVPSRSRRATMSYAHGGLLSSTGLTILATAIPSFFLGTLSSLYAGLDCRHQDLSANSDMLTRLEAQLRSQHHAELDLVKSECKAGQVEISAKGAASADRGLTDIFDSDAVGKFAVGMARTSKADFTAALDPGVPLDPPDIGREDVLILYNRESALPSGWKDADSAVPSITMSQAVEHCDHMHLVLTDAAHGDNRCIAIMPQYESFHIQNWMKLDENGKLKSSGRLQFVSRGKQTNGAEQFHPPTLADARKHWDMLSQYFSNVDTVLSELKEILERIVRDNTVIVMVCNMGQSELLMNFVCSARTRGNDLSNILVFTTDQETTDLAAGLGLSAYFDKRNFADVPSGAAKQYGDRRFVAMMMAKTICVQLVSMLGYNFLFQDVDIVWFKDPLEYFTGESSPVKEFDFIAQDDGGHSLRYAPYSANSGFYFVRHNERTRHFLTSLLMAGDLVLKTDSHQQALIAVLNEHSSLYGLKIKVLSRDMEEFPGGYQWNQKSGKYMRSLFSGEIHPYIFHMSWTLNKDNKLLYFRQFGEWYVKEQCVAKPKKEIDAEASDLRPLCCSVKPLFSCHYRDKPSLYPCKDSPPIDHGRPSWWQ